MVWEFRVIIFSSLRVWIWISCFACGVGFFCAGEHAPFGSSSYFEDVGDENWSLEWPLGMPMSGSQAESQLTQSLFESQLAQEEDGILEEVKEIGLETRWQSKIREHFLFDFLGGCDSSHDFFVVPELNRQNWGPVALFRPSWLSHCLSSLWSSISGWWAATLITIVTIVTTLSLDRWCGSHWWCEDFSGTRGSGAQIMKVRGWWAGVLAKVQKTVGNSKKNRIHN